MTLGDDLGGMTLGDDLGGITLGDDLGGMTCGGGRVDLAPLPVRPARAGDRLAAHRQLRHQDLSQGVFFLFFMVSLYWSSLNKNY